MKDNFSVQAESHAKYRPGYPSGLFEFINGFVKNKMLAWDCGTGNGQSAKELSKYFEKVYATDISEKQLAGAARADNIFYVNEPAEKTALPSNSAGLITVSQALHWFDFDKFYNEVKRVAVYDAVIAVWSYSLLKIDPVIDALIRDYHFNILKDYWDPERKYVDEGYANIPFPFEEIQHPVFEIRQNWTIHGLEGYLNTWSALQKFIRENNYNPVAALIDLIRPLWPSMLSLPVIFPIHLKMAYVH